MKVKAVSKKVSEANQIALSMSPDYLPEWQVTPGKEYFVYIIRFGSSSEIYGNETLYSIFDDYDAFLIAPASIFEIVDPRVSSFWEGSYTGGNFTLQPRIFHDHPALDEQLLDREQHAINMLLPVFKRMESEFS